MSLEGDIYAPWYGLFFFKNLVYDHGADEKQSKALNGIRRIEA